MCNGRLLCFVDVSLTSFTFCWRNTICRDNKTINLKHCYKHIMTRFYMLMLYLSQRYSWWLKMTSHYCRHITSREYRYVLDWTHLRAVIVRESTFESSWRTRPHVWKQLTYGTNRHSNMRSRCASNTASSLRTYFDKALASWALLLKTGHQKEKLATSPPPPPLHEFENDDSIMLCWWDLYEFTYLNTSRGSLFK